MLATSVSIKGSLVLSFIVFFSSGSECTQGFPSNPAFMEETIADDTRRVTVLIPDMNFTCNTTIAALTFTGVNGRGEQDLRVQIWRQNSSQEGVYYRTMNPIPVNTDNERFAVCSDGIPRIASRTYFCILNREYRVSVQPGDILGLEIPPNNDDDIDIFFTKDGPTNYVFKEQLNDTVNLSNNSEIASQLPQISFGFTSGKPCSYLN